MVSPYRIADAPSDVEVHDFTSAKCPGCEAAWYCSTTSWEWCRCQRVPVVHVHFECTRCKTTWMYELYDENKHGETDRYGLFVRK